jgi:peptide/nickel transport system permease protein
MLNLSKMVNRTHRTLSAKRRPTGSAGMLPGHRIRRYPPLLPSLIVALLVMAALFGGWLAPHSSTDPDLLNRLRPPAWLEGGEWAYPLGTDSLGRDLFSRILVGARISMAVAAVALLLGAAIGVSVALVAVYFRGLLDAILMRLTESLVPLPIIFFGMILAISIGPSFWSVLAAMAAIYWARYARSLRGELLSLMNADFVAMARVEGCSPWRIMRRHLLPNIMNTLIVLMTLWVGSAILVEASLSFLGAGVPPPTPSWGRMVSEGRAYVTTAWWVSTMPGLVVMLAVLSFNILGDWLRDRLDPRLRQL